MSTDIVFEDASIIIDLLKLKLFPKILKLLFKFHTTDYILNEIVQEEQRILLDAFIEMNTIKIVESDGNDIDNISIIYNTIRKLSLADSSIIYFANKMDAIIFSSDGLLRQEAEGRKIKVHGILWIFRKLIENDILSKSMAANKLKKLMEINTRLPVKECYKCLKEWEGK